ncbi:MAG: GatB/YqeY domain-containing protein [Patescibacteria group bacterium]
MSLRDRIIQEKLLAQKAHDDVRLSAIRMLFAAIRNAEIDAKRELSDDEITALVSRQVKQLSDALGDFKRGNRQDLVDATSAEIALLQSYLPAQMSPEEIEKEVAEAVKRLGASPDMGSAMKEAMKELKGKADGAVVRAIVEKMLK